MRFLVCFVGTVLTASCMAQDIAPSADPADNVQDAGGLYRQAEAHRNLAMRYLQESAQKTVTDLLSEAQAEFDRAAEMYLAYASSIDDTVSENRKVIWAASGLLESYHAPAALKLILEHKEVQHDSEILRVKADALLALGSGKEAALAYEQWIEQGDCDSTYRNWPGEPRLGHPIVPLMPRGINDPCAVLAQELRARLETLQRLFGHPSNLPKKNYPPYPLDTY